MRIIFLIFISITATYAGDSPTLNKLQNAYNSALEKFTQKVEKEKIKNSQEAFKKLKLLENSLQKQGQLEELLIVRELTKKGSHSLASTKSSQNKNIHTILFELQKFNKKADEQYQSQQKKLILQYQNALKTNIKKLTQQNKISEALVLQEELRKITPKNPQAQTTQEAAPTKPYTVFKTKVISHNKARFANLKGLDSGSQEAQQLQRDKARQYPLEFRLKKSGIVFRLIPPTTYTMGSPRFESGRDNTENQKQVTIKQAFYLGKFEISQKQWIAIMGTSPKWQITPKRNYPIDHVSWHECQEFIKKLTIHEELPEGTVTLPSETHWEWACRAGTKGRFYTGNYFNPPFLGEHYNRHIGKRKDNAFGMHDMHGNIAEWCEGWYNQYHNQKIVRGGTSSGNRSAARSGELTKSKGWNIGLRLMFNLF